MRIKLALFSIFCLLPWHDNAIADITLTNGYWSTSFVGCTANPARAGTTCDGLNIDDSGYPGEACAGGYSQIGPTGNYSGGAGGNGLRVYYLGGSRNTSTSGAKLVFTTPQKSFWLRFYYRLPSGQITGAINEHKIIYAFTSGGPAADVNWPGGPSTISLQPRGTMGSPDIIYGGSPTYNPHNAHGNPSGGNWAAVYGSPSTPANGSWHYYEFHFDLGTTGSNNGVFQMWVDGINVVNDTDLDWFNGGSSSPTGWSYVDFPYNHNVFTLSGCNPHDVDDIAVATPPYTGFLHDSGGRNMIGGLQGGKKPSPVMNIVPPPLN